MDNGGKPPAIEASRATGGAKSAYTSKEEGSSKNRPAEENNF
jgi:hypothetical protein